MDNAADNGAYTPDEFHDAVEMLETEPDESLVVSSTAKVADESSTVSTSEDRPSVSTRHGISTPIVRLPDSNAVAKCIELDTGNASASVEQRQNESGTASISSARRSPVNESLTLVEEPCSSKISVHSENISSVSVETSPRIEQTLDNEDISKTDSDERKSMLIANMCELTAAVVEACESVTFNEKESTLQPAKSPTTVPHGEQDSEILTPVVDPKESLPSFQPRSENIVAPVKSNDLDDNDRGTLECKSVEQNSDAITAADIQKLSTLGLLTDEQIHQLSTLFTDDRNPDTSGGSQIATASDHATSSEKETTKELLDNVQELEIIKSAVAATKDVLEKDNPPSENRERTVPVVEEDETDGERPRDFRKLARMLKLQTEMARMQLAMSKMQDCMRAANAALSDLMDDEFE